MIDKRKLFILIAVVALCGLIALFVAEAIASDNNAEPTLIIEETTQPEQDFNKAIDTEKLYQEYLEVLQAAETLDIAKQEQVLDLTQNQLTVVEDLNQLKLGNPDVVKKYFGESQKFTPAIVADRTSSAEIHFIVNPENTDVLHAHICTLDYIKMIKDYMESNQSDVALKIANGDYDICYTLQIHVDESGVVITEALKEAITGGWYESELTHSNCILK